MFAKNCWAAQWGPCGLVRTESRAGGLTKCRAGLLDIPQSDKVAEGDDRVHARALNMRSDGKGAICSRRTSRMSRMHRVIIGV